MPKTYLVGHPGIGKSTRIASRMVELIRSGVRPDRILVLAPQQSQADRYRAALLKSNVAARGEPAITTFAGLVQQHVGLYFPLIAAKAGFADTAREPAFLNVEAAQHFVGQFVVPYADEFGDLRVPRPRLISQILDDLNRSATSGFPLTDLAERLNSAWQGTEPRAHTYDRVQQIAIQFREFCLQNGLLDFSLTMDVFGAHMLDAQFYKDYVAARFRHVLVDNVEEGTAVQHDFTALMLKTCDSALLAEDDPGGFRLFLGADRATARSLREQCDTVEVVEDARLAPAAAPSPAQFGEALMRAIRTNQRLSAVDAESTFAAAEVLGNGQPKYWTTMLTNVVDCVAQLVADGAAPAEIAIVAPIVEDVLRFELEERLKQHDIGLRALRPSRPLYDNPITRMLITWAKLAYPTWNLAVSPSELARALARTIGELDIVRAQLIADAAQRASAKVLPPLDDHNLWARVGMPFQVPYARLQQWLARVAEDDSGELAVGDFWQQFHNEILSQPGFAMSNDGEGAKVAERLWSAARQFTTAFLQAGMVNVPVPVAVAPPVETAVAPAIDTDASHAYVTTLTQGLLAAQYAEERKQESTGDGVLLTPAFSYVTSDLRSRYQVWLDLNANTWHERLYQPLTQPYVLSRGWRTGMRWTDDNELAVNRDMLARLVGGLSMRCTERVFLAQSRLNVAGAEEDGLLARTVQRMRPPGVG